MQRSGDSSSQFPSDIAPYCDFGIPRGGNFEWRAAAAGANAPCRRAPVFFRSLWHVLRALANALQTTQILVDSNLWNQNMRIKDVRGTGLRTSVLNSELQVVRRSCIKPRAAACPFTTLYTTNLEFLFLWTLSRLFQGLDVECGNFGALCLPAARPKLSEG